MSEKRKGIFSFLKNLFRSNKKQVDKRKKKEVDEDIYPVF